MDPASNAQLSFLSDDWTYAVERCYKGVTYVIFPNKNAAVGSVALTPDGKPIPCGP